MKVPSEVQPGLPEQSSTPITTFFGDPHGAKEQTTRASAAELGGNTLLCLKHSPEETYPAGAPGGFSRRLLHHFGHQVPLVEPGGELAS